MDTEEDAEGCVVQLPEHCANIQSYYKVTPQALMLY